MASESDPEYESLLLNVCKHARRLAETDDWR
jgi:hypothetical protein